MWKNIVAKQKLHGETLEKSTIFQRKNHKTKFLTSLIVKNKIDKDNFKKYIYINEKKIRR
jgi:hypothetical protein